PRSPSSRPRPACGSSASAPWWRSAPRSGSGCPPRLLGRRPGPASPRSSRAGSCSTRRCPGRVLPRSGRPWRRPSSSSVVSPRAGPGQPCCSVRARWSGSAGCPTRSTCGTGPCSWLRRRSSGGLGRLQGLLVVAASLVPAYLCNRLVENPIRFAPSVSRSHGLALSLGGGFTMVGVVAGLVLALAVPVRTAPPGEQQAVGAGSLLEGGVTTDGAAPGSVGSLADIAWWVPDATEAIHDVPDSYADGCQQDQVSAEPIVCEWGDLDGDLVVAAVGDSKLVQWQPALDPIAAEQGWHVYSISKSACAFGTGRQVNEGAEYTSCTEWNERTLEEVLALQPDVVLVGNRINEAMSDPPDPSSRTGSAMVDGLAERWQQLIDAGIPVVVLLDNPN